MIAKALSRIGIEVWKDLPEYEGLYQVSNLGNVRSLKFNKIRYIKSLNDANLNYSKSPLQRKKFRHYSNLVFLKRNVSGDTNMVLKITNTKSQISPR